MQSCSCLVVHETLLPLTLNRRVGGSSPSQTNWAYDLDMNAFFKWLRLDKWLDKQAELGKKEREKDNGQEPTKSSVTIQTSRNEEDIIREYKASKKQKHKNLLVAIAVLVFCIWAYSSGSTTTNNSATSTSPGTEESLTNWIPSGFNSWSDDPNVSWRWLENKEYECDYDRACSGIMIIARSGCDRNLYAEVSILDKNNVQIGYTNDTLSSALPMEESKLIFNTYEESADTFRLSKISCY